MRNSIPTRVLVAVACVLTATSVRAQKTGLDMALTYNAERSQTASSNSGFWLQGGGADAAFTVFKGIGVAGSINGEHASNVQPGVDVNKIVYLAGPRYTRSVFRGGHLGGVSSFAQVLFGGVHAFGGLFPGVSSSVATANSFAIEAGAGADLRLLLGFGVRLFEVDYVHTALPNDASNLQNDVRLAFGATYHF